MIAAAPGSWVISQLGKWTGEYPDRISAIHAGDVRYGGQPFFVGKVVTFDEWLTQCWYPLDDIEAWMEASDCQFPPAKKLEPMFPFEAAGQINRELPELAAKIIREHNCVPLGMFITDSEEITRDVPRAWDTDAE